MDTKSGGIQQFENYIFTEGGTKIGLGHITRCIALYDELIARNLKCCIIVNGEESIKGILGNRNYVIENWYQNWQKYLYKGKSLKANCIIDSYIAEKETYYNIQKSCNKALYIDDTNRISYPEGIIVNPSIYGNQIPYDKKEGQVYVTGSEYVILRKEFQNEFQRKIKNQIKNILVILGGSDMFQLTPEIMEVLSRPKLSECKKCIVIGNTFTNIKKIEDISNKYKNFKLYYSLDAYQLSELMKECDYAITAAGQVVYELTAMKLPFSCIKIIDNQVNNIKGLLEYKIIDSYFDFDITKDLEKLRLFIDNDIDLMKEKIKREKTINNMKKSQIGMGAARIIDTLF